MKYIRVPCEHNEEVPAATAELNEDEIYIIIVWQ